MRKKEKEKTLKQIEESENKIVKLKMKKKFGDIYNENDQKYYTIMYQAERFPKRLGNSNFSGQ